MIRPCGFGGGLGTAFARLRDLYGHEPAARRRLRLRAAVLGGVVDGRSVPRLSVGSTTVCLGSCKRRSAHIPG